MTSQQIENIKKEIEIIKKSHIEIIELKITISEIKNSQRVSAVKLSKQKNQRT